MSNEQKYNGWTNYETWNVALWFDQDDSFWTERAEELVKCNADNANYALSKEMQEQSEEQAGEVLKGCPTSMYADLLNASLRAVNWYEIAEKYTEAIEV